MNKFNKDWLKDYISTLDIVFQKVKKLKETENCPNCSLSSYVEEVGEVPDVHPFEMIMGMIEDDFINEKGEILNLPEKNNLN